MLRRAQQAVIITFVAAFVVTLPKILFFSYVLRYNADGLPFTTVIHEIKSRSNVMRWSDIVLFAVLPLLGVIIPLNTAIVVMLKRTSMSKNDRSTRMIVAVVTAFVVLKLPMTVSVLLAVWKVMPPHITIIYRPLARDLTIINSAVNFIIYFAAGKEFRRHLRKTFCHDAIMTHSHNLSDRPHSSNVTVISISSEV